MKRFLVIKYLLISIFLFFQSCSLNHYHTYTKTRYSIDFTQGNWLFITNTPYYSLNEKAEKDFSELIPNRFTLAHKRKGIILPLKLEYEIYDADLKKIKQSCNDDFLIYLYTETTKENSSSTSTRDNKTVYSSTNEAKVSIKIYDLKTGTAFYDKEVVGNCTTENKPYNFSNPVSQLINGAYNKLIKDIKKNSIK